MDPVVESPPWRLAGTAPAAPAEAAPAATTLPLGRLYALRAGYLVVGVGLAVYKWPLLLHRHAPWTLMEGVANCMFVALSLLALLGVRYPLRMLPVLLFESAWKLIWLVVVALPQAISGQLDPATRTTVHDFFPIVIVLAVIPWRYVLGHYVAERGDRWRSQRSRPAGSSL